MGNRQIASVVRRGSNTDSRTTHLIAVRNEPRTRVVDPLLQCGGDKRSIMGSHGVVFRQVDLLVRGDVRALQVAGEVYKW